MMNSPFVRDMAQAVSMRYADASQPVVDVIRDLYQRILLRDADADDVALGEDYIVQQMQVDEAPRQMAIASFVQILFSSTEFRFID